MPCGLTPLVVLALTAAALVPQEVPPAGTKPPLRTPAVDIARALDARVDAKGGWEALGGLDPVPATPCTLFELDGRLHCVAGDGISVYDPERDAWERDVVKLPRRVGLGVAAAPDRRSGIAYLVPGESDAFLAYDARRRRVDALPPTPQAVGRGGALALLDGRVYALRGARSRELHAYDLAARAWTSLPDVGRRDEAKGLPDVKVVGAGISTGFLIAAKGFVYAWPDHHVQRFDVAAGLWFERTWASFGVRPSCDGGAFAWDPETSLVYVAQGMDSNALGAWDPAREGEGFHLLRPRLPEPLHGEGSRAAIASAGGRKHLYVYAVEPGNRLWRIPLDRLERIGPGSRAADAGSPYESFHEATGASLVRRPGPLEIRGAFGAFKVGFYFLRLDGLRLCDPVQGLWTEYPGVPLGAQMTAGAFAVAAGDFVYFSTGAGDHSNPRRPRPHVFARIDPLTKQRTPLAPLPLRPGRGSRGARVGGAIWALRGDATRDVLRYDMAAGSWSAGPPLPPAAAAPGASASGLVALGASLFAFPDEQVWRLDTEVPAPAWTPFARLPFRVGIDGGMTALDEAGAAIYVVRGDVSRSLARLDLASGAATLLAPDLPDVVSVEGERAVVRESEGRRCLFIMRGHDSHEIWRVPLEALRPVR